MLPRILDNLFSKKTAKVKVTAVNVKFLGEAHGLNGLEINDRIFYYELPFQNKIGSDLLPEHIRGPPMTVSEIRIKEPFRLLEATPSLPVQVPYKSKISFRLKVEAPDMTYDGPLAIEVMTDSAETININIPKITLHYGDKSMDVDSSSIILPMRKNQIFKRSIQLYKIFELNARVNGVEVNKPFEIVSTEPNLPITLDKKDSYIISLYIKAPQFNYAGTLDIRLK